MTIEVQSELYLRLCQAPPTGKMDLSKYRRFLNCCRLTESPLLSDLATYSFTRCLKVGERRLDEAGFTRAMLLFSAVVYPDLDCMEAWNSFYSNYLSHVLSGSIDSMPSHAPIISSYSVSSDCCVSCNEEKRQTPSDLVIADALLNDTYSSCSAPEKLEALLETSEARSETIQPKKDKSPSQPHPSRPSPPFLSSSEVILDDSRALYLVSLAERFEAMLLDKFETIDRGFRFLDNATRNRSGRVSLLKFTEACEQLHFFEDIKALFFFLDSNCDGYLELEEFKQWRSHHRKTIRLARAPMTMT